MESSCVFMCVFVCVCEIKPDLCTVMDEKSQDNSEDFPLHRGIP